MKPKHGYHVAVPLDNQALDWLVKSLAHRRGIVAVRRNRFGKYIVSHLDLRLQSWSVGCTLFVDDDGDVKGDGHRYIV